jgi:hypothetical protein
MITLTKPIERKGCFSTSVRKGVIPYAGVLPVVAERVPRSVRTRRAPGA